MLVSEHGKPGASWGSLFSSALPAALWRRARSGERISVFLQPDNSSHSASPRRGPSRFPGRTQQRELRHRELRHRELSSHALGCSDRAPLHTAVMPTGSAPRPGKFWMKFQAQLLSCKDRTDTSPMLQQATAQQNRIFISDHHASHSTGQSHGYTELHWQKAGLAILKLNSPKPA